MTDQELLEFLHTVQADPAVWGEGTLRRVRRVIEDAVAQEIATGGERHAARERLRDALRDRIPLPSTVKDWVVVGTRDLQLLLRWAHRFVSDRTPAARAVMQEMLGRYHGVLTDADIEAIQIDDRADRMVRDG